LLGAINFVVVLTSCQAGISSQTVPAITTAAAAPENEIAISTTKASPPAPVSDDKQLEIAKYPSGSTVELSFLGPDSIGLDPETNPFALQVDVILHSPDGSSKTLPAFYDGDGHGGLDGDVWKARYLPKQAGIWHYEVHSEDPTLDGTDGSFEVVVNPECDLDNSVNKNLNCKGQLEYAGGHYLQFQDGEFWLKTGLDDPENFLGTAFGDWDAKRTQIDLLNQLGVNSIYVITNNIGGDRRDTWPWVGETESQARSNADRFDVARLQAWEDFFSYVQGKGIVLHFVFNDDSAWRGYDEYLYIREMVARFGHHPGTIWNVGEEANEIFTDQEQLTFAAMVRDLDPNNHTVTVHRKSPWPFLGDQVFDSTSIQIGDGGADFSTTKLPDYNTIVIEHREGSSQRGHPIPIMIDETPRITEVNPDVREKFRTQVLYPILMGGGNFELHYRDAYGQSGSVRIEDLEPLITDMVRLRRFLEELPFPEMQPCNQLLTNANNICFGDEGMIYMVYLPSGGSEEIDLHAADGTFEQSWFNPRTGEITYYGTSEDGQLQSFTAPDDGDWVLLLMKK
jgi:hypothetical protein